MVKQQSVEYLWRKYAKCFNEMYGLDEQRCYEIGQLGSYIFGAEYTAHGDTAYATSIVQPLRNAYYAASNMGNRLELWAKVATIVPPVLDYGCGIGFSLAWFAYEQGMYDLYGWEPPGQQRDFIKRFGPKLGFEAIEEHYQLWNGKTKFNTVMCQNVLEHLSDPMATLEKLRGLGGKVIANIDLSEDEAHIAPRAERERVLRSLVEHGETWQTLDELDEPVRQHI